ncbi:hypothetical protein SARC_07870 [Sphaeroforma arctica JP610]|uniref:UvrD-like helicase ATP-binding domain-containing protein n=1 Tax=Sphaeroforma arctica JP610 TaxID=667725 RepID=A0A0L0FUX7_9EUKA|nr:hypothetical protein SARC_07870 [Sphaeroforma arctica JP610]KNC79743.1 hypothetical protein SARC_07870 [Sphaeroforma arctica JP610]|eukprot:XP_014153645.1 hypothetical protein SARC_07870 [Sphaeroforma arctica JP610]
MPVSPSCSITRISLLRAIGELKRGLIAKRSQRKYIKKGLAGQVFRSIEVASYCLVWHIEVNYSKKDEDENQKDVIFPRHDIDNLEKDVFKSQAEPSRQYEFTNDVINFLEDDKADEKDMLQYLPYMLDETQKEAVVAKGSTVLVGRSGTGRPTVFASRLFSTYSQYVKLGTVPPPAMFTSHSGTLVEQVRIEYENRVRACTIAAPAIPPSELLDDVLPEIEGEKKLLHQLEKKDKDDALDTLQLLGSEVQSAPKVVEEVIIDQESLVDFERFERVYYKLAENNLRKACSPAFVFAEIMTVLKGRAGLMGEPNANWLMSKDEYINIQQENDSTLRFFKDRRIILYAFFQKYEKERLANKHIDVPSIVQNLMQRSRQATLPTFKGLYVDEVQDLLPCQWQLFKRLKNQHTDFMCGGDQAQSITAGNRFRFNHLKAFMYDTMETRDGKKRPDAIALKKNYRTFDPVLQFANKVLDMLRYFFPKDVDSLTEENGKPIDDPNARPRLLTDSIKTSLDYPFYGADHLGANQVILVRDEKEKADRKARLASNMDA